MGNIFLQIVIDGEAARHPLSINWPMNKFCNQTNRLLPRFEPDEECYQHNLMIENELSRANRLKLEYYVSQKKTDQKHFKNALNRYASRENVLDYMYGKKIELVSNGLVDGETGKKYITCLNRLKEYSKAAPWKFNSLKLEDILKFDSWMRRDPNWSHNTVCATMRVLHKFFACARLDSIPFDDPMTGYKMPGFTDGVREILEEHEISILKLYHQNATLTDHEQDILTRYLFSCFTGLRKSDIEQFDTRIHLRRNVIRLDMFKTRRYGKTVEFVLPNYVLTLIGKKRGRLFPAMESSLLNKTLRKLVARAGIDKYLKFHSGRDTFATTYLILGGNLADLKDILGHSSIKTTEIYLKMTSRTKNNIMAKFDDL